MNDTSDFDFGQTIRGFVQGQRIFSRYRMEQMLGRGGMGVVWRAFDEKLQRDVALKFMPELVRLDSAAIDELKQETCKSLELTHKNIVRIYDIVEDSESAAISMEFVDGSTLSALRVKKPNRVFEVSEIEGWVKQICEALEYAHHDAHVVHRDLKPANLMLNKSGQLKVTDFGIARSITDSMSRVSIQQQSSSGSPPYMSPQQVLGRRSTASDDIYSLGATIYDLLTGKPPFYTGNIYRQIEEVIPPSMQERRTELNVTGEGIPAHWENTIAACLAKDPAQRPKSAGEVMERLKLGTARALTPTPAKSVNHAITAITSKINRRAVIYIACGAVACCIAASAVGYFGFYLPREKARIAEEKRILQERHDAEELKHKQDEVRAALALAESADRPGNYQDAAKKYEEVLRLDPNQAEAKTMLASIHEHLANARGSLFIATEPSGAAVQIDSKEFITPVTVPGLHPGKVTLKIAREGYEPLEQQAEVVEEQTKDLGKIVLTRSIGSLAITTEPSGQKYEVTDALGHNAAGVSPAKLDGLAAGSAHVVIHRDGWPDYTTEVTIKRQETTPLMWDFAMAKVPFTSNPTNGELFIDGKDIGKMPTEMDLPVGQHKLHATFTDAPDIDREFLVAKDSNAPVECNFDQIAIKKVQDDRVAAIAAEKDRKARESKIKSYNSQISELERTAQGYEAEAQKYINDANREIGNANQWNSIAQGQGSGGPSLLTAVIGGVGREQQISTANKNKAIAQTYVSKAAACRSKEARLREEIRRLGGY